MSSTAARVIDNVADLVEATHLAFIQYYEVGGRRFDGFDPALADEAKSAVADSDVAQVRLMQRHLGNTIAVRCRMEVRTPEGTLTADVAAFFQAEVPFDVSNELAVAFAERVANPIIRPYLREALHNTAVRLGMEPPLLEPLDDALIGDSKQG